MPSRFETFTYKDAADAFTTLKKEVDDAGVVPSRNFRTGNHLQKESNYAGWIGPGDKKDTTVMAEIEVGFISQNVIGEVSHRRNSSVIGREPGWNYSPRRPLGKVEKKDASGQIVKDRQGNPVMVDEPPNDAEQKLINLAEGAQTEWWDAREILKSLQESGMELTGGRSLLRLFVPPGLLVNNTIPTVPFEEAFDFIYISLPLPEQATIIIDVATQRKAGLYSYEHKEGDNKYTRYELCYVDDAGQTVVKILTDKGDKIDNDTMTLNLGGRLTLYEMKDEPFITAQVRQHQCLLNMARTMMGRNVVLAGFLERIYLNAQKPGEWVVENGVNKFKENPVYAGAASTMFASGLVVTDKNGNPILDNNGRPTIADPSVVFRDPVPVQTFEDTAGAAYKAILSECHQLHALISGDATASGESRKQAMDDFRKSLEDVKAQMDAAGRWLLETSLAMAAQFSGQAGKFEELRAVFDCQIDVGDLSADDRRVLMEEVEKNLRSRENYMVTANVTDDPDAELVKITTEKEKLEPMETVRLERAKTNLALDKQSGDVRGRIEAAAQGQEAVN